MEGASVNPIPNMEIGQQLLDSAYFKSDKVAYNYYNGKVITFRSSNDNKWHSYEIMPNQTDDIPNEVLKVFKTQGLISNIEYKKLIKNKSKKR